MTFNEYQKLAMRTRRNLGVNVELDNAVYGVIGEVGEVIDILKKHKYHGHDIDKVELAKELGDTIWYIVDIIDLLGLNFEDICKMNIEKLEKRYPKGYFRLEDSINRGEDN